MDNLERFIELRAALQEEQAKIMGRLQEIERALGSAGPAITGLQEAAVPARRRGRPPGTLGKKAKAAAAGGSKGNGRGRRNEKSLKEAVVEVLATGKKTKREILEAVTISGYQFTTSNPLNSLGVILYGKKPKFKNDNGYFSLA